MNKNTHTTAFFHFAVLLYPSVGCIFQIVPPSDPKICNGVPLGFLFYVPLSPLEHSLVYHAVSIVNTLSHAITSYLTPCY